MLAKLTTAMLLATFAGAGAAQAPSPAPGADAVARHTCEQPEYPGRLASDNQMRGFNKRHQAYAECMKKYIAEQQKIIGEQQKITKAHADAASAAIDEYNKYVETVNAQMGSK